MLVVWLLLLLLLGVQVQELQPGFRQLEAPLQLRQQLNGAIRVALPADIR
jgi:hypothetical protein